MSMIVAIILGVLSLAFVLYPLYRPTPADIQDVPSQAGPAEEKAALTEREQAARNALQEVELDFQLGNISETDYGTLRERYMQRALVALKSRYDREQELDAAIEEELRKMKEQESDATP